MQLLSNPTGMAVNVPTFGISLTAGQTIEVSDEVAAAFVSHPVLRLSRPATAPVLPPAVTVPIPAVSVAAPAADTQEGSP